MASVRLNISTIPIANVRHLLCAISRCLCCICVLSLCHPSSLDLHRCACVLSAVCCCVDCNATLSCHGHGDCDMNGDCACTGAFTDPSCSSCTSKHYGPSCAACSLCSGHGVCQEGIQHDGSCVCEAQWTGADCQFSNATTCNGHGLFSICLFCVLARLHVRGWTLGCSPFTFDPLCVGLFDDRLGFI